MGHLLHILAADHARLTGEPIMDDPQMPCEREDLLAQIDNLSRLAAELQADIETMRGDNATPQPGCYIQRIICGDAYVLVEYDYLPAEDAIYDVESPVCGPGQQAEVVPLNVFINGAWCDISDVRFALDHDRLCQTIEDARAE